MVTVPTDLFFVWTRSLFYISNIYCKQPTGTNLEMKNFKL